MLLSPIKYQLFLKYEYRTNFSLSLSYKALTNIHPAYLWGLGVTYALHLLLIGKPAVDFLFVIMDF